MDEMIKVRISAESRYSYNSDGMSNPWAWCWDKFGQPGTNHTTGEKGVWDWDSYLTFLFDNEKDAILFALRWA
jgi:hypothetical protein